MFNCSPAFAGAAYYQSLARGKVLLVPTARAMEKAFLKVGLFRGVPGPQPDVNIPTAACMSFKAALPRLVALPVGRRLGLG